MNIRMMVAEKDQVLGVDHEGREVSIQADKPYLMTEPDKDDEVIVISQYFSRIPVEFFREVEYTP